MIPETEQHKKEIIAICEEYGLKQLELFGSAATGEFDPEQSDVDFLIEYPDGFNYGPWGQRTDELNERLSTLMGRKVDLVVLRWIDNPYVLRSIERQRIPIYGKANSRKPLGAPPGALAFVGADSQQDARRTER